MISLILRVAAAIILFLLAFQVIDSDYLYWLAGALGLYVTATVFGNANFNGALFTRDSRER